MVIAHAKAKHIDIVLIDSAGRMQSNKNLLQEMKKMARVADPDLKIFVGDALAGNDALSQAKEFNDAIGIDGAILTKIDADPSGGAALSVAFITGRPVVYVGIGQGKVIEWTVLLRGLPMPLTFAYSSQR